MYVLLCLGKVQETEKPYYKIVGFPRLDNKGNKTDLRKTMKL